MRLSFIHGILNNKEETIWFLTKRAEHPFDPTVCDLLEILPFVDNIRDEPEFNAILKPHRDEKEKLRAQLRKMEEQGRD